MPVGSLGKSPYGDSKSSAARLGVTRTRVVGFVSGTIVSFVVSTLLAKKISSALGKQSDRTRKVQNAASNSKSDNK